MNKLYISTLIIVLMLSLPIAQAEISQQGEREDLGEVITINVDNYIPTVVPSAIVAEQNVNVRAHLQGATLGSIILGENAPNIPPLYHLPKITKIVIMPSGQQSKYTTGTPVHIPPYGKVYTQDGNSIDLGYALIKLDRIKKEADIPDVIDLNLTANIYFNLDEGFGVFGTQDLLLTEANDEQNWKENNLDDSAFWNRRGYVRAFDIKNGKASFEIYDSTFDTITTLSNKNADSISNSIRFRTGKFEDSNLLDDRFRIKVQKISFPEDKAVVRIEDSSGKISYKTLTRGMPITEGSLYKVKEIRTRRPIEDGEIEEVILEKPGSKKVYLKTLYKSTFVDKTPDFIVNPSDVVNAVTFDKLVEALIKQESNNDPNALSCTGAAGIMQLVVGTANDMSKEYNLNYPSFTYKYVLKQDCGDKVYRVPDGCNGPPDEDRSKCLPKEKDWRFDPKKNRIAGERYLNKLLGYSRNEVRLAIAGYLDGEGKILDCRKKGLDYTGCIEEKIFSPAAINHVQKVISHLNRLYSLQLTLDDSKPIYIGDIEKIRTDEKPQETNFITGDPCKQVNILSNKDLTEGASSKELYCTAIQEFRDLIDTYPESDLIAEAYEAIGDIYSQEFGTLLLARENYEVANDKASIKNKERIKLKLDDINRAIGEKSTPGSAYLDDEQLKLNLLKVLKKQSQATSILRINGKIATKKVNEEVISDTDGGGQYTLRVIEIESDFIRLRKQYPYRISDDKQFTSTTETIRLGGSLNIPALSKDHIIDLIETDTKEEAIITILPGSGKEKSTSDFSLHIPIEKRPFTFTPEEIDNKIARVNKLIEKLDSVINKLDKTLKIWKATCLITWTVLTIKNSFLNPVRNLARRITMRGQDGESGWNKICRDKVTNKEINNKTGDRFYSYEECIEFHSEEIEKEIDQREKTIEQTKEKIKSIGDIRQSDSRLKLSQELNSELNSEQIKVLNDAGKLGNEEGQHLVFLKYSEVLSDKEEYATKIKYYIEQAKAEKAIQDALSNISDPVKKLRYEVYLRGKTEKIDNEVPLKDLWISTDERVKNYFVDNGLSERKIRQVGYVYRIPQKKNEDGTVTQESYETIYNSQETSNLQRVFIDEQKSIPAIVNNDEIFYDSKNDIYYVSTSGAVEGECQKVYAFIGNPEIQYDNKGKPFLIPVQTPQLFNNRAIYIDVEFDDFGVNPIRYEVWNVGLDGLVNVVNREINDDCQESEGGFDDNTQESRLVQKAYQEALKGGKSALNREKTAKIKVLGKDYLTSVAVSKASEALNPQCTDVFSYEDCQIMFGICDPVMCPASRFDFGDTWRVDNVVQTGIIGSMILGLKNKPVPAICLTGISAGLQNIKSILLAYNECLQRVKVSGEYVGICDAITNIYLCETLWREGISLFRLRGSTINWISKEISSQGDDGGEYLTFKESLKNVEESAKFFTKDYAQSTFKNYIGKSVDEVGSEICKAAIYSRTPSVGKFIDQILQPESPPQFTAVLNVFPVGVVPDESGRVIREESRYEIYYHIFAGNNKAIRYSVYLKDQFGRKIYVTSNPQTGRTIRASLGIGQYTDQTIDFNEASGFNEVCIEIDGLEKCGFGSVSSAFSLNFLKDEIVKSELSKKITNEKECVQSNTRFSPSIGSLNNIDTPSSYWISNTGILRKCSVEDPGRGNSNDWKKIPDSDCGKDEKGRDLGYCWINLDPNVLNLDYVKGNKYIISNLTGLPIDEAVSLWNEEQTNAQLTNLKNQFETLKLSELECSPYILNKKDIIKVLNDIIPKYRDVIFKTSIVDKKDDALFAIGLIYKQLGNLEYNCKEKPSVPIGIEPIESTDDIPSQTLTDITLKISQTFQIGDYNLKLDEIDLNNNDCKAYFVVNKYGTKKLDCGGFSEDRLIARKATESMCEAISVELLECFKDGVRLRITDKIDSISKYVNKLVDEANNLGYQIKLIVDVKYLDTEKSVLVNLDGDLNSNMVMQIDEYIKSLKLNSLIQTPAGPVEYIKSTFQKIKSIVEDDYSFEDSKLENIFYLANKDVKVITVGYINSESEEKIRKRILQDHPSFKQVDFPTSIGNINLKKRLLGLEGSNDEDALIKLNAMKDAAVEEGIDNFDILSGFISFEDQKENWNNKYSGISKIYDNFGEEIDIGNLEDREKILSLILSTRVPGMSRYHFGTDFDLCSRDLNDFKQGSKCFDLYRWLQSNAKKFDFCQPYAGFGEFELEEKWHWGFIPKANQFTKQYQGIISPNDFLNKGIAGENEISKLYNGLWDKFVSNINPECAINEIEEDKQGSKTCKDVNNELFISHIECHSAKGPCFFKKDRFLGLRASCLPCTEITSCEDLKDDKEICANREKYDECYTQSPVTNLDCNYQYNTCIPFGVKKEPTPTPIGQPPVNRP